MGKQTTSETKNIPFKPDNSLEIFPMTNLAEAEVKRRALSALAEEEYGESLINVEELLKRKQAELAKLTKNALTGVGNDVSVENIKQFRKLSADKLKEEARKLINQSNYQAASEVLKLLVAQTPIYS